MDEGIGVCRALLDIDGTGHTAIIHTRSADLAQRFATAIPASRILVNSPGTQGLMGLTTGLIAVADAGMRHVGRQFHDQQRHLQGPAEHQARRLLPHPTPRIE